MTKIQFSINYLAPLTNTSPKEKELNIINQELNTLKEDVDSCEKFIELLNIIQDDINYKEYLKGTTIIQFLINWNNDINKNDDKIDPFKWKEINKRTLTYYRLLEGKFPEINNKSQYVFFGKKVAYIIATITMMLEGI